MRGGLRFVLIVGLACIYVAYLRGVFQLPEVAPASAMALPVSGEIATIYGNHDLACLLLYRDGSAEMFNAGRGLDVRKLPLPKDAARFTMGCLTQSGTAFLMDDRGSVTRSPLREVSATSKPLQLDGKPLAMAVEEKRGILWVAVERQEPHAGDLFVLAVGLSKGKILSTANLERQGAPTHFEVSANGEYVLLSTDGSPGVYFFDYKDKTPMSKYVPTRDLVTSVAYDGDFPVLGLRSGGAVRLDPETWRDSGSVDSGQYSSNAVAVSGGRVGIGHGFSSHGMETGSFQSVDMKSWETADACVARSEVTAVASTPRGFLYGEDSGAIGSVSKGGCEEFAVGKQFRTGPVRFMASVGGVCLVVGKSQIVRFVLKD